MGRDKFVLVNLQEEKSKKLGKVITNESCLKILDYLADKDATESQLAKELNQPLSTVHYNMQQLMKAGLVVVDEYHYSPKGKEVNHYKLAHKYIIIAPKDAKGLKTRLRSILPAALVAVVGAGILSMANRMPVPMQDEAPVEAVRMASAAVQPVVQTYPVVWFLAGATVVIAAFIGIELLRKR